MNQELNDLLSDTFGNNKLSRAQKQALAALLSTIGDDRRALSDFREQAFERAKAEIPEQNHHILNWLEMLMKAAMGATTLPKNQGDAAWFSPGPECRNQIEKAIDRVQKSLDICVFTISDDRIVDNIIAAHRRGVAVRIISDNDKSFDAGSDIERLYKLGVPLRVDQSDYHMHHKFAIMDEAFVFTGSYNWTRSAAEYNEENLVKLVDSAVIADFSREFEELWSKCTTFPNR